MSKKFNTAVITQSRCHPREKKPPGRLCRGSKATQADFEDYGMKLRWTRNVADQTPSLAKV
jgi:hypothetical protein